MISSLLIFFATVSFLGYISLNNGYVSLKGNLFENISSILKEDDLVVENLECLLQGLYDNLAKLLRLYTTPEVLKKLNCFKINILTLAQNHFWDNCNEEFDDIVFLGDSLNINYLSAGRNLKKSITK